MNKKYLPYIVLILAALLLFYVKKNQRGHVANNRPVDISVPADQLPFNREESRIIYSKHARCRMDCRHIDEAEVKDILETGVLNEERIERDNWGTTYPLEGVTKDKQHVRIVFAPGDKGLVVVTVIDLEKDWYCDCK